MLCLHTLGWWSSQHVWGHRVLLSRTWLTDGLDSPLEMCSFSGKKRPGRGPLGVVCTSVCSGPLPTKAGPKEGVVGDEGTNCTRNKDRGRLCECRETGVRPTRTGCASDLLGDLPPWGLTGRWRWGRPASQPCQLSTEQRQTIATGDQGSFAVVPRTSAHQDMG